MQALDCSSLADLPPIGRLDSLQTLKCSSDVTDRHLKNLTSLDCSSRRVADLSPLAKLRDL